MASRSAVNHELGPWALALLDFVTTLYPGNGEQTQTLVQRLHAGDDSSFTPTLSERRAKTCLQLLPIDAPQAAEPPEFLALALRQVGLDDLRREYEAAPESTRLKPHSCSHGLLRCANGIVLRRVFLEFESRVVKSPGSAAGVEKTARAVLATGRAGFEGIFALRRQDVFARLIEVAAVGCSQASSTLFAKLIEEWRPTIQEWGEFLGGTLAGCEFIASLDQGEAREKLVALHGCLLEQPLLARRATVAALGASFDNLRLPAASSSPAFAAPPSFEFSSALLARVEHGPEGSTATWREAVLSGIREQIQLKKAVRDRSPEAAVVREQARATLERLRQDLRLLVGTEARLSQHDEIWEVVFGEESAQLKHSAGLTTLAELLRHPGRAIPCWKLEGLSGAPAETAEPLIDEEALRTLVAEITMHREAIDNDGAAASERAMAPEQLTGLEAEYQRVVDKRGRIRRTKPEAEKLRMRLAQRLLRLRRSMKAAGLVKLAAHLGQFLDQGDECGYLPPLGGPQWRVEADPPLGAPQWRVEADPPSA
jgi:hypothetical protein